MRHLVRIPIEKDTIEPMFHSESRYSGDDRISLIIIALKEISSFAALRMTFCFLFL